LVVYAIYFLSAPVNPLDSLINNSAVLLSAVVTLPLLQAGLSNKAAPGRILWQQGIWMLWLGILLVIPAEMSEANTRQYIDGVIILSYGMLALGIFAEARNVPLGSWLAVLGPGTIFVAWTAGIIGLRTASTFTFLIWTITGSVLVGISIATVLLVYRSRANNAWEALTTEAKAREALASREAKEAHRLQLLAETLAQPDDFPSFLHRSLQALVAASGYPTAIYLAKDPGKSRFTLADLAGPLPAELNLRWRHSKDEIFPPQVIAALLAGETVTLANLAPGSSAQILVNQGIRSLSVAPVRESDHVAGLVVCLSFTASIHTPIAPLNNVALTLSRVLTQQYALSQVERERESALRSVGLMLEYRDFETKGHTDRVTNLSTALGMRLELSNVQLRNLRWGAYLHDVGKIAIPDSVLFKAGSLEEAEWKVMRHHTITGEAMLHSLGFIPEECLALVRSHHERWDGHGYPDAKAGNAIPFLARIFTIADVYDALVSPRPYKAPWQETDAVEWISVQAGTQFDPDLVPAFLALIKEQGASLPEESAPTIDWEL
jgi:putative nucleotidyltransferase with HDIG domain